MTVLEARAVITPSGVIEPGRVHLDGGLISAVETAAEPVPDVILAPGFVDLQVNGHEDVDVGSADGDGAWDRLDQLLLAQGVTTWCPTLVSAPLEDLDQALDRVKGASERPASARPSMAGVHLEGPFLSVAGAHRATYLRPPDRAWLEALPSIVSVVTLAPELPGAPEAIRQLARRGMLVGLGHSSARLEEAAAGAAAGARLVTHLFNAMEPFHHRRPGLAGAGLADPRLSVSLIADLVHLHPAAIAATFAAKGAERVALITDAVAWRAGRLGAEEVGLSGEGEGVAPRRSDGTLAGSVLTMDRAVANVVERVGASLGAAVLAASSTPAGLLGLTDRGALETGRRADIVALGPDLRPTSTWVGGRLAWEA